MRALWLVPAALGVSLAYAEAPPDKQRVLSEACSLISQQRNVFADQAAVADAQRKIAQERVEQWDAYFRAYTGAPAS